MSLPSPDRDATEVFTPVSQTSSDRVSGLPFSSVLNAAAGLFFLTGLLVWIWSSDWRFAATGFVVAIAMWIVSNLSDTRCT